MARFSKTLAQRAQKFADRLKALAPDFNLVGPRGNTKELQALAEFLAAQGSKNIRLAKTAKGQLMQQDSTAESTMRSVALQKVKDNSKNEITEAMDKYTRGRIDAKKLKSELTAILRRQTLASAIVGVRGVGNLTENVLTAVKRQLAVQLAYLDGFMEDLQTRTVTQRDKARALQYANAGWSIAQTAQRQFNLDMSGISGIQLEEMRKLGGAEHCDDCIELAGSWEPFGTLPAIGQGTVCGSSCACTMEVRPITDETKQQAQITAENPVPQG